MDNRISNNVNFGMALHMAPEKRMIRAIGKKAYSDFVNILPKLEAEAKNCDIFIKPEIYMFQHSGAVDIKVSRRVDSIKNFFKNLVRDLNLYDFTGMRTVYPKISNNMAKEALDVIPELKKEFL